MTIIDEARLDKAEILARYEEERDKRLREDGNDQYVEMKGEFARYLEDPYVEPAEREPLFDEVDVVLIGGGFAGLIAGARLKQAGIDDVRIIEKGGDFGGTWYWNRYPGAQCDVESYVYLPLLEETEYVPSEKYSHAPEILEHCQRIAKHFGLYDNACLSTEVTGMEWDADISRWIVSTNRGDRIKAKFVTQGNGPLHKPKLPGIPGLTSFQGHTFHTSRWDYDYTGGDPAGSLMDKLADKRVGIIGTGATSVQCIPHLGRAAGELFVFQRTPSSVDERGNRPTDPSWAASLEPGWQAKRIENFTALTSGGFAEEDLVQDGWTDVTRRVVTKLREGRAAGLKPDEVFEVIDDADLEKMGEIRHRVDEIVEDEATAHALKAWYRQFCKRPCFHDEYLPTFNRPNVHLIDTDGQGVSRITEKGVVVDGVEYELDCIIYATGFEVGTEYTRRSGYDLVGKHGKTLSAHWDQGMRTMHGMHVHGFPNMFVVGSGQGGFTANFPHLLEECSKNIAYIIGHALEHGIREVEVTAEAEQAWVDEIVGSASKRRGGFGGAVGCTPGYYNNEGKKNPKGASGAPYPKGPTRFFALCEEWRDAGELAGLELRT